MVSLALVERSDSATGSAAVVLAHAIGLEASLTRPLTRDDWLDVVGDTQRMINVLTAIQDLAIAEAARRESIWTEDGTLGELVHAPGRVVLDAADLLAPAIGASHAQAQRRVESAVRLAHTVTPLPAELRDLPTGNGLDELHAARLDSTLDAYRAGVIADELQEAPADVARTVVDALQPHLEDDAPTVRRRCRRLLARISPDLLRQRAARARTSTGLRRWVSEPGVDAWYGTFPSEEAAVAWAAIDARAHELVADGTCTSVEQARGRALTDLVTEHATVEVQVVLTVPADAGTAETAMAPTAADVCVTASHEDELVASRLGADTVRPRGAVLAHEELVEVNGARPSEPLLVSTRWLEQRVTTGPTVAAPCDPTTGSRVDPSNTLATGGYRPGPALVALVEQRDGRCRFPGCSAAARFCDLDHVRPWPLGPTAAVNLLCLCRRHHRIKQRPGWRVRLDPDGTAHWTDPTGRSRSTAPLDVLSRLVL